MKSKKISRYIIVGILIVFALVTVFMSSSVLFDWFGIRAKEGNFVPFIVKTNLTMGIVYLIAAYGYIKSENWTLWLMLSTVLILIFAFVALFIHIQAGGLYETKTIAAMTFRIVFTILIAGLMHFTTIRKK
ncbi:hypothetical protein POV26_09925 [Aequorivita todarodis]|uniref:hypothetical protein n=1 Tax=Aequorivita todarodis TaxID=2036821 RepID=UPI002350E862|nr:hypothetical protein [Aequorivita todarodis]MDC8001357.1 hypothetical protein [Aequorivita todarodis]